jgi:hypothetical protein
VQRDLTPCTGVYPRIKNPKNKKLLTLVERFTTDINEINSGVKLHSAFIYLVLFFASCIGHPYRICTACFCCCIHVHVTKRLTLAPKWCTASCASSSLPLQHVMPWSVRIRKQEDTCLTKILRTEYLISCKCCTGVTQMAAHRHHTDIITQKAWHSCYHTAGITQPASQSWHHTAGITQLASHSWHRTANITQLTTHR